MKTLLLTSAMLVASTISGNAETGNYWGVSMMTSATTNGVSGYIGTRIPVGNKFVVGGELGVTRGFSLGTSVSGEGSLGYTMGGWMPYVATGLTSTTTHKTYSVGANFGLTKKSTIGVKFSTDALNGGNRSVAVRWSFKF